MNNSQVALLNLTGMHCTSCAGLIERSVKKVPGVTEVNVNFASEKARIVYNSATTKIEDLIKGVESQAIMHLYPLKALRRRALKKKEKLK